MRIQYCVICSFSICKMQEKFALSLLESIVHLLHTALVNRNIHRFGFNGSSKRNSEDDATIVTASNVCK